MNHLMAVNLTKQYRKINLYRGGYAHVYDC